MEQALALTSPPPSRAVRRAWNPAGLTTDSALTSGRSLRQPRA